MRAGYPIAVRYHRAAADPGAFDAILRLEGRRSAESLARRDIAPVELVAGKPDLVLDLVGGAEAGRTPRLTIDFNGQRDLAAGLSVMLAGGADTQLVARLDHKPVAEARPMLDDRVWLGRAASGMLAGAATLIEMCVQRFAAGLLVPIAEPRPDCGLEAGDLGSRYARHLVLALGRRTWRKLTRRRPFYWRTAYRFIDGPGIAETGHIGGAAFTELKDDGARFYADPFAFEHRAQPYLFVEEYPYADGRGVISVAELGPDGRFGTPVPAIVEPHHLSYPQVFARGGAIYLIPEASAARELVLYRAVAFPHKWERAAVLVSGRRLNDMTLLERDGRLWLIGTEQVGRGSASDTMVAWSASAITGPWAPHRMNPIRIDHSAARPGGRFIERDGKLLLPFQDGSASYGGGLGLAELLVLNDDEVQFGPVTPIGEGEAWPGHAVHTLTRAGRLEAIDSASRGAKARPVKPAAAARERQTTRAGVVPRLGA